MKNRFQAWHMLLFFFLAAAKTALPVCAEDAKAKAALHEAYISLKPRLESSPFKNPLWLSSSQESDHVSGEIHGILKHPFPILRKHLQTPADWCEILFLHLNIKYCRTTGPHAMRIYAGTKRPQSLDSATEMNYAFKSVSDSDSYLKVGMTAKEGPYGTSMHYISLEAIPLDERQSFIHIRYGYRFGGIARFAMSAYLATTGSQKEGLGIIGRKPDGSPEYTSGMKGVTERNTLRYYLAIDAWLDSLSEPEDRQEESRLAFWFDATEHYPQLHEISRQAYMSMKREERRRMQEQEAGEPAR